MTISETDILETLDRSQEGTYSTFIWLGEAYSHLIDSRLNVFRDDKGRWAIATERLGFNPRGNAIKLEISYHGNCLVDLDEYNGETTNYYQVLPIDMESFGLASNGSDWMDPTAEFLLVRGQRIELSHDRQEYLEAGIELKEYESEGIRWEEAARLFVPKHRDLFRATDQELFKSIPKDMKKILVIDEWYHKDFLMPHQPSMSDGQLRQTYEFNKKLTGLADMDFLTYSTLIRQQERSNNEANAETWNNNRPSVYETWQLVAAVISIGDVSLYRPTLASNSHWKNWPESGSL